MGSAYSASFQRSAYRRWKDRHPDGLWAQWLKKAHGLAPEQWASMWADQAARCYLCEQPLPEEDRGSVVIDHDHDCCPPKRSCGACRRGLAHVRCNNVIGFAGDDPDILHRIACNLQQAKDITAALRLAKHEQGELVAPCEMSRLAGSLGEGT